MAQRLPFTYTGADFYALCSDAMLKAVMRQATNVDARIRALNESPDRGKPPHHRISTAYYFDHFATPDDVAVTVTEADFMAAHRELVPSVSAGELAHYEKVRAAFEGSRDQQGRAAPVERRPSTGAASAAVRAGASSQGKGNDKGKGKAVDVGSSNNSGGGGLDEAEELQHVLVSSRAKGKAKAVAGFRDGTASDDDELY